MVYFPNGPASDEKAKDSGKWGGAPLSSSGVFGAYIKY